jgi:hypothetical protein
MGKVLTYTLKIDQVIQKYQSMEFTGLEKQFTSDSEIYSPPSADTVIYSD